MALDLTVFADKLRRYRIQFDATIEQVSTATGIPQSLLVAMEAAQLQPNGDQILILADYYRCDFKFFISHEQLAPFEQTEKLFRRFGDELSPEDRWAIQEFLFLCENEEYLTLALRRKSKEQFIFRKTGSIFKKHGKDAAQRLREHLGYTDEEVPSDIFHDFRRIGIHVFRRKLKSSKISGLFLRHPTAGKCILVNYSEDIYRQRFTAAHEAGHSILDESEDFVVSFKFTHNDVVEIRANFFAGNFLLPRGLIEQVPTAPLRREVVVDFADRFRVNTDALLFALQREKIIDQQVVDSLRGLKIPKGEKVDPELPDTLSDAERKLKTSLLQRGISTHYASLCFDAYNQQLISAGRLAEMLIVEEHELHRLGRLFGWRYGDEP